MVLVKDATWRHKLLCFHKQRIHIAFTSDGLILFGECIVRWAFVAWIRNPHFPLHREQVRMIHRIPYQHFLGRNRSQKTINVKAQINQYESHTTINVNHIFQTNATIFYKKRIYHDLNLIQSFLEN